MARANKVAASVIVAALGAVCFSGTALAGNCFAGAGAATDADLLTFTSSPTSIMAAGAGSSDVTDRIRTLVATNSDLTASMIALASATGTTKDQMAWIGAGLGRATSVCRQNHPDFADAIQTAVAEAAASNPALADLLTAFNRALLPQQLPTAALGAAGAGATTASNIGGPGAATGTGNGGNVGSNTTGARSESGTLKTNASGGGGSRTVINQSASGSAI